MIDKRFPKWDVDVENGTIFSLKQKRFIGRIDEDGYLKVGRYNKYHKHQALHQYIWMVANQAEIPEGYSIHHIDHNKLNNSIYNLELVEQYTHTNEHNKEKKIIFIGEKNPFYGKQHTEETKNKISQANKGRISKRRKQVAQYTLDGELVKIWDCVKECAKYGFSEGCVGFCCRGKQDKHKGFKWKYLDNGKQYE